MSRHALAHRLTVHVKEAFSSLDDLLRELQITLAALADIECSYERDCERIEQWSSSEVTRAGLRAERRSRRCREREPHLRKLGKLQHRIRARLTSGL
jgi:hypothetical protein